VKTVGKKRCMGWGAVRPVRQVDGFIKSTQISYPRILGHFPDEGEESLQGGAQGRGIKAHDPEKPLLRHRRQKTPSKKENKEGGNDPKENFPEQTTEAGTRREERTNPSDKPSAYRCDKSKPNRRRFLLRGWNCCLGEKPEGGRRNPRLAQKRKKKKKTSQSVEGGTCTVKKEVRGGDIFVFDAERFRDKHLPGA